MSTTPTPKNAYCEATNTQNIPMEVEHPFSPPSS